MARAIVNVPLQARKGEVITVKALVGHVMETGFRHTEAGAIVPREPFYTPHELPDAAEGCGLVEAARGALGHWLRIERRHLVSYQIIAPTSWNFSPRDAAGVPGALESALVGAPVRPGETTPVSVQHVVRSFDPCMVCTVH